MEKNYLIHYTKSRKNCNFMEKDYLVHFGILGQKWGIRRYQNPDGSLTEEGRKRYLNSDGSLNKKGQKLSNKKFKEINDNWYKAYNEATNEFNVKINRINNKDKYKNYKFDYEFTTKKGQEYIKEVSKLWKDTYGKYTIDMFGDNEITKGKEYVKNMPFYYMYDEYIKK